ncbi:MAG: DUF763 domain-containing protein [Candidatus Methanomethylicia archaeon]
MGIYGIAELPLHYGVAPRWLFNRMVNLASEILEIMYNEFGEIKIMERISNPLWFQAFSNVLGFDWHSSGSTTVTCGVLREALEKMDINLAIAGGKGRKSLKTLDDINNISKKFNFNEELTNKLKEVSRLVAKIDNSAVQDGFNLYHHVMLISKSGDWSVIQQGMNIETRFARRYHWYSKNIKDLVEEPHTAISCPIKVEEVLNLVAKESHKTRKTILDLINEEPNRIKTYLMEVNRILNKSEKLDKWVNNIGGHETTIRIKVFYKPINEKEINWKKLEEIYKVNVRDFKEFLLQHGVGPSMLRALSLISELIYNDPPSKRDPVTHIYDPIKWSYAVGGKDGVPYPISKKHYDDVILELRTIIEAIRKNEKGKIMAFKNLKKISEKWGNI